MKEKHIIHLNSLEDLPHAATEFLEKVGHRKVFAFSAEMGVGKTTFITALLKAMGISEVDGSPTYSLVNVYDSQMFGRIYHFDLYRINDAEEALDIGIEEMLYGNDICFIEWPDKIEHLLPDNVIWSYISKNEDNTRILTVEL